MSCIRFSRRHGFHGLFPVGKMCFVDNTIRDPVCGDHPFATATTTCRRGPANSVRHAPPPISISIGLFREYVKIAIVRRTKRYYSGITKTIKGNSFISWCSRVARVASYGLEFYNIYSSEIDLIKTNASKSNESLSLYRIMCNAYCTTIYNIFIIIIHFTYIFIIIIKLFFFFHIHTHKYYSIKLNILRAQYCCNQWSLIFKYSSEKSWNEARTAYTRWFVK